MPIYEYQCNTCRNIFQILIMSEADKKNLLCTECKGKDLNRLISRVAYHMSDTDRLNAFDPNARKDDGFYKDTRNIGLAAQKKAKEMGVDLGGGFEGKLDKLRTDPGSVLKESD